jgi:hypothetical protein
VTRQPGEPTSAPWDVANPDAKQDLQFKLRVIGTRGSITNPTFEIDRAATLQVPVELTAGQTLLVERDAIARVYDAKGNQVKSVALRTKLPLMQTGKNAVLFDCDFQGDAPPKVLVNFKTMAQPSRVRNRP